MRGRARAQNWSLCLSSRAEAVDVIDTLRVVQQVRGHEALSDELLVQGLQPSCLAVLPAVNAVHHAGLLRVVEGADEGAWVVHLALPGAARLVEGLLRAVFAQEAALEPGGGFALHGRRRGLLHLLAGGPEGLSFGLLLGGVFEAVLQLLPNGRRAVVRQALLAGAPAGSPVLGLPVAGGLVGPEDGGVVAADVGRQPDGPRLGVGLQRVLVLQPLERGVAVVLQPHRPLALLQKGVDPLGRLVELGADLLVAPPRGSGHLSPEGLEGRHASAARRGLRHALRLRGVRAVVQAHGDDRPRLLAHRRQPQLRVVAARDPGYGHVQRRGAVRVLPLDAGIAVQQLQTNLGTASRKGGVKGRRVHARLFRLDVGPEVQHQLHTLRAALPARGVEEPAPRHRVIGVGVCPGLQQSAQGIGARRRLLGPIAKGGMDKAIGDAHDLLRKLPHLLLAVFAAGELRAQRLCPLLRHPAWVSPHQPTK
eukprot:CAMPEP_0175408366 /NCGR_PEP_ID=MMETSP0095-20121207/40553_1 /TAXON_ID=311494 /ORGANISM="Alexandrium monilatum, Strain CCMP3105" /LENGTH=478 /DNA_ID=CAMNT_0016707277 /DNA_START=41 /DNA_END=1478 /DNA_ORIENTATION=-